MFKARVDGLAATNILPPEIVEYKGRMNVSWGPRAPREAQRNLEGQSLPTPSPTGPAARGSRANLSHSPQALHRGLHTGWAFLPGLSSIPPKPVSTGQVHLLVRRLPKVGGSCPLSPPMTAGTTLGCSCPWCWLRPTDMNSSCTPQFLFSLVFLKHSHCPPHIFCLWMSRIYSITSPVCEC